MQSSQSKQIPAGSNDGNVQSSIPKQMPGVKGKSIPGRSKDW